jgi:hypothetical protein
MPQEHSGGLPSRVTSLSAAILRHSLNLSALAAAETRLLIRQSLASILLVVAMAVFGVIAYVALIGAGVSLLALKLCWGLPVSLAAAGMIHLAFLGIAYAFLKNQAPLRPYEATSAEIRRDIETLSGNSPRSGQ